jgi:hypothetical protein
MLQFHLTKGILFNLWNIYEKTDRLLLGDIVLKRGFSVSCNVGAELFEKEKHYEKSDS